MLPLGHGHTGRILVVNDLTIHSGIFPSRIRVFCHHAMKSAYVPAAIQLGPMGGRKLEQIDIIPFQDIFLAGSSIHHHGFYRSFCTLSPDLD